MKVAFRRAPFPTLVGGRSLRIWYVIFHLQSKHFQMAGCVHWFCSHLSSLVLNLCTCGSLIFHLWSLNTVCLCWPQPVYWNVSYPWHPSPWYFGCASFLFWGNPFSAQAFGFVLGSLHPPRLSRSPLWIHLFCAVLVCFPVAVIRHWQRATWGGKGLFPFTNHTPSLAPSIGCLMDIAQAHLTREGAAQSGLSPATSISSHETDLKTYPRPNLMEASFQLRFPILKYI